MFGYVIGTIKHIGRSSAALLWRLSGLVQSISLGNNGGRFRQGPRCALRSRRANPDGSDFLVSARDRSGTWCQNARNAGVAVIAATGIVVNNPVAPLCRPPTGP